MKFRLLEGKTKFDWITSSLVKKLKSKGIEKLIYYNKTDWGEKELEEVVKGGRVDWFFDGVLNGKIKVKDAWVSSDSTKLYFMDGIWIDGVWENGLWRGTIWENGTWKNGTFREGIWKDGTWKNGIWEYNLKTEWWGGEWLGGRDGEGKFHPAGDAPNGWGDTLDRWKRANKGWARQLIQKGKYSSIDDIPLEEFPYPKVEKQNRINKKRLAELRQKNYEQGSSTKESREEIDRLLDEIYDIDFHDLRFYKNNL